MRPMTAHRSAAPTRSSMIVPRKRPASVRTSLEQRSPAQDGWYQNNRSSCLFPSPREVMKKHLVARGGLIYSGVLAANTSAVLRLFDHSLAGLLRSFLVNLRGQSLWSTELLTALYRFIPRKDLRRDLLLPAAEIC